MPGYNTNTTAGMNLHAKNRKETDVRPMDRTLMIKGLYSELTYGQEAQTDQLREPAISKDITGIV